MRAFPQHARRRWPALAAGTIFLLVLPLPLRAQGISDLPTVQDSNVGYIDSALVGNRLRLRFDDSFDDPRPSRAEFFYPQAGPFKPGPPRPDPKVDFQELAASVEALLTGQLSAFVEVPERFLHPEVNPHAIGLSDLNTGFKYAFLECPDLVTTFQFRTYVPTGDGKRGLGTEHVSLEPALLVFKRFSERFNFEGELRDWVPVGGTDFAGNVVRYGVGVNALLMRSEGLQVVPVLELVGWTVLGGKESVQVAPLAFRVKDALGDTIINAKFGVRLKVNGWGDLYTGYGQALTGDRWYANTFRIEWRLFY